jgi:hypothetical protein
MGKFLKLIAVNLAVLLACILVLNLFVSIYLDVEDWVTDEFPSYDERIDLPNFVNKEWSNTIFTDTKRLSTRYEPFVAWSRDEYDGEAVHVNAQGDRVHPLFTDDPVGHIRFFGGSTTWGTGVDDAHSIPALFNALNPDWEVHNHGESGFISRQELARLIGLVNSGEPTDLVVFYDGYNEVRNLCRNDVELYGHGRQKRLETLVQPPTFTVRTLFSAFLQLAEDNARRSGKHKYPPSRCMIDPEYGERIADMLTANWKVAREVARLGGADFVAILQPVAAIGNPNLSHLVDDAFSLDDYATPAGLEKLSGQKLGKGIDHRIVYPRIQRRIAEEELDFVLDLTDAYDGDEFIYMGPSHVTGNGNERIAKRLQVFVGKRLREQAESRRSGDED